MWAHVQGTGVQNITGTSVVSQSVTTSGSVTVGNLLVVQLAAYAPGGTWTPAVFDGANTWVIDRNFIGATNGLGLIAHAIVTTGGIRTVTVSTGGAGIYPALAIDEFSYTGSLGSDGTSFQGETTTSTPATGTLTVTGTDLIAAFVSCNASPMTVSSYDIMTPGYSAPNVGSNAVPIGTGYLLNRTTNYAPNWTLSGSVAKTWAISAAYSGTGGVAASGAALLATMRRPAITEYSGSEFQQLTTCARRRMRL